MAPARCPNCQSHDGEIGEACPQRGCVNKQYRCIPLAFIPAHGELDPRVGRAFGSFELDGHTQARYLVLARLGAGGFGTVYRALDQKLTQDVALKLLLADAADPQRELHRKLFANEARALAALSHPNIVKLLDTGIDHDTPFIAMEYIGGARTLKDELETRAKTNTPLRAEEAERMLSSVLAALEAAHAHDIVHRDIKPENIMLQELAGLPSFVRVLDFGLAKFVSDSTRTKNAMGTPRYMAPEQLWGRHIGRWTDLFAVGVMTFELMTGRSPFGKVGAEMIANKKDAAYDPMTTIADLDLPRRVLAFLGQALAYQPEQRFPDVTAFRAGLRDAYAAIIETGRLELTSVSVVAIIHDDFEDDAPRPATPVRSEPLPIASGGASTDSVRAPLSPPRARRWPWAVAAIAVAAITGVTVAIISGGTPREPSEVDAAAATRVAAPVTATTSAATTEPVATADTIDAPDTLAPDPAALAEAAAMRELDRVAQVTDPGARWQALQSLPESPDGTPSATRRATLATTTRDAAADAKVELGKAQLAAKRPDKAEELAQEALAIAPDHAAAKALADDAKRLGNAQSAEKKAEVRRTRLDNAKAAIAAERWDEAKGLLEAVLEAAPADSEASELMRQHTAKKAAAERRARVATLCTRGRGKLGQQDFDGADADAAAALELIGDAECGKALSHDVDVAREVEAERVRKEEAAKVLEKARDWTARGRAAMERGELDGALGYVANALDAKSDHADAIALRSEIQAKQRAAQLAQHRTSLHSNFEAENWDAAISSADKVLALAADDAEAQRMKRDAAKEKAGAAFIETVEAQSSIGVKWAKLKSAPSAPSGGPYAGALAALKSQVAKDLADDRVRRGRDELASGDLSAARDWAEEALEAVPGHAGATKLQYDIAAAERAKIDSGAVVTQPIVQPALSPFCCTPLGRAGPFNNFAPIGSACSFFPVPGSPLQHFGTVCP